MRVLVIKNYPMTPLGHVADALKEAQAEWELIDAHAGVSIPGDIESYAGVVVLGGAQNALDDIGYPHLQEVCSVIRQFHDAGKPVLGICLGAQLIARTFGAENILDRPMEFGWHEVKPTSTGLSDPVIGTIGEEAPLFQWHTDTFTLPEGAELLAASAMTSHQAFRIGQTTYATQFHFEAGLPLVRYWTEKFAAMIAEDTPDWQERFPSEAERNAEAADRAGLDIARAWVRLLRD